VRQQVAAGALDRAKIESIDARVRSEMTDAVRFALDSPYPAPGEAYKHVYAQGGQAR
jgi:TPP-dependent pyruvate/acetoin dehydrogenase alpha subunit